MKKHYRKETNCLNCGTTLEGHYCHNCGQENLEIKESFGHMMNHAVSDYFHFDHQFFHTLKPLLFKPGYLTNEYMAGKRVQFLHPVKMYIFISVVYFFIAFKSGGKVIEVNESADKKAPASGVAADPAKKKVEAAKHDHVVVTRLDSGTVTLANDTTVAQYHASQAKLSPEKRDGFITRIFSEKVLSYNEEYGSKHGAEHFTEDIQHNIPKMMFVLLPLFALFLSIAFRKSKKYYVEHLIFTFHFHCFLFLFISAALLLKMALPADWKIVNGCITALTAVYIFWYFYRALRVVYHRSRLHTVTKLLGITLADFATMMACVILLAFITALI